MPCHYDSDHDLSFPVIRCRGCKEEWASVGPNLHQCARPDLLEIHGPKTVERARWGLNNHGPDSRDVFGSRATNQEVIDSATEVEIALCAWWRLPNRYYRNLPRTESKWCVFGSVEYPDGQVESGMLEWCHDEIDAITIMEKIINSLPPGCEYSLRAERKVEEEDADLV